MKRAILLVLATLALTACPPDPQETGDTTPEDPAVGAVFDLDTDETGVLAQLDEPGTYVVILFSQAEDQSTFYGYGALADTAARTVPGDALPPKPLSGPIPHSSLLPDNREFRVWNGSGYVTIEADAEQVTEELVIWKDLTTENPLGDPEEETFDDVVDKFEQIVLPRTRQIFGEESDIDGSERIDVLVSYTVNQYGVVAYVSTCDIAELAGCGSSGNGGEIIYMGIPDPESSYSSASAIVELWAHELNHLVYTWHKYVGNDLYFASENIYLTEGFSELAQDLTGFNNGNQYIWASAIDMRDFYGGEDYSTQGVSINDFIRGDGYYDYDRDGPLRGGAYLFLRYLFEQAGGMDIAEDGTLTDLGGMAWIQDWFAVPELGAEAVEATTGAQLLDLAMDWYTAIVVTGRDLNDEPAYNYQPRVQDPLTTFEFGVDPFANIHGWLQLTGPPIQPVDEADGQIRAGGVEYLQVVVDEPGMVVIPVDAEALPRARAFRIE